MALTLEKNPNYESLTYDQVAETIIELGNRMLAEDESAHEDVRTQAADTLEALEAPADD